MRYLNSLMEWTEPEVANPVYSINYKGTGPGKHDHSNFFQNPITKAAVGDTVTVELKNNAGDFWTNNGGKPSYIGITDSSITELDTDDPTTLLEQVMKIDQESWSKLYYTFTMPNHDVTVWIWCIITLNHDPSGL